MNRKPDNLNDALRDIASAPILKSEFERYPADEREPLKSGINFWDDVQPEDFGPEWDFELKNEGSPQLLLSNSLWIFNPISKAAIQWCYKHLPEDCPRWGSHGFAIETRYIKDIVDGAKRDGLMSEQDWIDGNNEADDLARQWEDQE